MKLTPLIEKLFVMLVAGSCAFVVTYLRDITQSLDKIRDRMGEACEQISAIEANMKSFTGRMSYYESRIDMLERINKRGG